MHAYFWKVFSRMGGEWREWEGWERWGLHIVIMWWNQDPSQSAHTFFVCLFKICWGFLRSIFFFIYGNEWTLPFKYEVLSQGHQQISGRAGNSPGALSVPSGPPGKSISGRSFVLFLSITISTSPLFSSFLYFVSMEFMNSGNYIVLRFCHEDTVLGSHKWLDHLL